MSDQESGDQDEKLQGDGRLVIVSGPSGVGKGTLLREVFADSPVPLVASVSATTRSPRPGEVDGTHYHFLSSEEFETKRLKGDFLECFEVFRGGHWYGTLNAEVEAAVRAGKWIVLEIDVQGALAVMERHPEAISIFIRVESMEELERRLRGRGTEAEEAVQRRLAQAGEEMTFADQYRHYVVNDDLTQAAERFRDILKKYRDSNHV